MAVICSPGSQSMTLTSGMPFAWRLASGRSHAFDVKTRPALREEQHVVVRVADDEVPDGVLFARHHAGDALAAAPLQPVGLERDALHVAAVGERDDGLLVRDEVFFVDVVGAGLDDLRAALVAVVLLDLDHVVADQAVDLLAGS